MYSVNFPLFTGPVPIPRDTNRSQYHNPPSQGLKPQTLKPPGKKAQPSKQSNELEERLVMYPRRSKKAL